MFLVNPISVKENNQSCPPTHTSLAFAFRICTCPQEGYHNGSHEIAQQALFTASGISQRVFLRKTNKSLLIKLAFERIHHGRRRSNQACEHEAAQTNNYVFVLLLYLSPRRRQPQTPNATRTPSGTNQRARVFAARTKPSPLPGD